MGRTAPYALCWCESRFHWVPLLSPSLGPAAFESCASGVGISGHAPSHVPAVQLGLVFGLIGVGRQMMLRQPGRVVWRVLVPDAAQQRDTAFGVGVQIHELELLGVRVILEEVLV